MAAKPLSRPIVHKAYRIRETVEEVNRQIVILTQYLNEAYDLSLYYGDVENFEIVKGVTVNADDSCWYFMPDGESAAKLHEDGYYLYEPSADNIHESRVYFQLDTGYYLKVVVPL